MNPSSKGRRLAGITLIELLAAMSVLSVILLLALQVTNSARNSIRGAESKSANDAIARQVFNQIAADLSQIVIREDARIEFSSLNGTPQVAGNDKMSFLARSRGLISLGGVGTRAVSLVTYSLTHSANEGEILQRGSIGNTFGSATGAALNLDASQPFPAVPADNVQAISGSVLRLEIEYLIQGAAGITRETTAPATSANLRGLVISLVVMNDRNRRAVGATFLPQLAAQFPDALPDAAGGASTLANWASIRDSLARGGYGGLPREALQAIGCYQRTFLIP